jgi:hypothetical protein
MKTKYKVGALVTSIIYDEFEADSEKQAKEMMRDKYGDISINLCSSCSTKFSGLSISEEIESYEVYEVEFII